jgi:tetratricopeptide (TPR) repeat protein
MSDPLRTEPTRADAAPDADRDAKIEQLLLTGLDHYFAGQHEQAINVWTRALFLDRSHARARAYIERARSALAEGQRESEELLQRGLAAFRGGDGDEARRLLHAAISRGAPSDEALIVLDRLNRLELQGEFAPDAAPTSRERARTPGVVSVSARSRPLSRFVALALAAGIGVGLLLLMRGGASWRGLLAWGVPPAVAPSAAVAAPAERSLPLPRRGETALARAHALAASGRLRDALAALDLVRPTDPERPDADRLKADIQRRLLSLAAISPQ